MRRVLFRWHGLTVYSYAFMLYTGLVVGVMAGNYAADLARLDSPQVYAATFVLLVPALAGARLLFVAQHWEVYRREPRRIWRRSEGGAAMYGGLLFALPVSVPLLRSLQLHFGAFWDVATFTILIGMIFTRVGCLLNGCCGGRPTTGRLSLYLPDQHGVWTRRVPTQLFEAAWAILLLAGAARLWRHMPFPGALFLCVLAGYGLGRLVLEPAREAQDRIAGIPVTGAISAALVAASGTILLVSTFR